jgi:hypothetical protein
MCALCGALMDGPHWTERGTDAGRAEAALPGRRRYLERCYRVALLNRVLARYGCTADDWAGNQYIVRNRSGGATEVVTNLPQLWLALETITRKTADPLDPELIARLEKAPPVTH